jgi:DNA ligase 1
MKVKPMLAYKVNEKPIDYSANVFMQPKLDGVRCLFTKDGAYSRNDKQWLNVAHIENELRPFFEEYPDMVLDGELYNHDLKNDFEKIISLVRKTKPTDQDRIESKALVQFHCYDFVSNINFGARNVLLGILFSHFEFEHVVPVLTISKVTDHATANAIHAKFLSRGYEGSILRLDKPYEQKRSYNLQKFKDFHDTEATIIDYVPGKGKRTGTLGKFIMRDDDGIEFGCPPGKGFNHKDLANILHNISDYIGKTATFTYFERTKANSYRHPQFKCLRNYE